MNYTKANNTYSATPKDDWKDRISLEIGDSKQLDFKPQVKIMRWDNEVNFSARLKDEGLGAETVSTDKDKVVWTKGKREVHLYDIAPCKEHPEGGYEFEVILKEKPVSNVIEFSLETKGLDFFYQPALEKREWEADYDDITNLIVSAESENVLDIGGGRGDLVKLLTERGIQATCLDSSDVAYQNRVTENFIHQDILDASLEENGFNLATGIGFLKHIPKDKIDDVIRKIAKVSKKGLFFVGFAQWCPPDIPIETNYNRAWWLQKFNEIAPDYEVKVYDISTSHRPENIEGSYAVYASEQKINYVGGKEYKCGKVGHIFRPKIFDSMGTEAWGELSIDTEKGILSVVIPQEFLDKAIYPIRHAAGLEFGYHTAGTAGSDSSGNKYKASLFTSPADASVAVEIGYYCNGLSGYGNSNSVGTIWLHSNLTIVGYGGVNVIPGDGTNRWYTSDLSSLGITGSTEYLLGIAANTTNVVMPYDNGDANQGHVAAGTYLPGNFGTVTHSTKRFSVYCTYTAGGAGPAKLKTWNGLAVAKIKTINGLAIAKVKTINGLI